MTRAVKRSLYDLIANLRKDEKILLSTLGDVKLPEIGTVCRLLVLIGDLKDGDYTLKDGILCGESLPTDGVNIMDINQNFKEVAWQETH